MIFFPYYLSSIPNRIEAIGDLGVTRWLLLDSALGGDFSSRLSRFVRLDGLSLDVVLVQ